MAEAEKVPHLPDALPTLPTVPNVIQIKTFEKKEKKNEFHTIEKLKYDVRWEPLADRFPTAIKLVRRGKSKQYIATISKDGQFADLYTSWEPIIRRWELEREANGHRRTNHNKIGNGNHPELAVGANSVFGVGRSGERRGSGLLRDTPADGEVEV
jgi:hypothetical protein